eukprot:CAMPEP_0174884992 /NCGR_PEP_ID=MMETSP0167-20121228/386_1 /TAXON_ID=38298 /ORGANISM="Rhodella maculata, Strain CCMP736" /LENGTH=176 /DNA_ID=CAMNT_0016120487 /DNA_START=111 /DNA_END=637 /DNA_ORIENTATION=-
MAPHHMSRKPRLLHERLITHPAMVRLPLLVHHPHMPPHIAPQRKHPTTHLTLTLPPNPIQQTRLARGQHKRRRRARRARLDVPAPAHRRRRRPPLPLAGPRRAALLLAVVVVVRLGVEQERDVRLAAGAPPRGGGDWRGGARGGHVLQAVLHGGQAGRRGVGGRVKCEGRREVGGG